MDRISAVFFFFSFVFILVIFRLFYIQVWANESLRMAADSQHYFTFSLPAVRGEIRAQDSSPLVMNDEVYLVYAEPKNI